jgi:poly(hydroxyalkanoate) depolymerase family esterase
LEGRASGEKGTIMNNDFVAEILRATGTLRAGDPAGATDIIQAALAAGGLAAPSSTGGRPDARAWRVPEAPGDVIDGTLVGEGSEDDAGVQGGRSAPRRGQRLRRPLGEVLRTLTDGRKRLGLEGKLPGLHLPARAPDLPLPEGAAFHDRHHACAAGARRYRLYVPTSAGDGLQGLVVMLHGCTQNPEDFAAGTGMNALAEEHRLLVAYPAQTNGDNTMACWNWFRPGDQMRGEGEPAIIAGLTESLRDEFDIGRDRIFVAGLSAGGAMAAIMAETYPDLYAGVGIHSGLAYGSANDVMSAFAAMQGRAAVQRRPGPKADAAEGAPRVIVFHGSADATVHPSNADRIVAGLRGAPAQTERSEHPGDGTSRGHARTVARRADGAAAYESWIVDGAPHAWFGGNPAGSYTDPQGPNASAEMVRFFLEGGAGSGAD